MFSQLPTTETEKGRAANNCRHGPFKCKMKWNVHDKSKIIAYKHYWGLIWAICSHVFSTHSPRFFHTKEFSINIYYCSINLSSQSLASISPHEGRLINTWTWLLRKIQYIYHLSTFKCSCLFSCFFHSFCRVPTPVAVIISAAVFALAHRRPAKFLIQFVLGSMLPFKYMQKM